MAELDDLKHFELSHERGFLPVQDPARALPRELAAWDEVGADLPKLLAAGRARAALAALPPLDPHTLPGGAPLRRAMLLLSYFGHAYVWGGPEPDARIPAAVAVPWCAVAARLGRPPVLSYASYALDNWRRLDPTGPLDLSNLAILQNFLGGADEDWFILVHLEIEARAARVLRRARPGLRGRRGERRARARRAPRARSPRASSRSARAWAACPSCAIRTSTTGACARTSTAGRTTRCCRRASSTRASRRSAAARSGCAARPARRAASCPRSTRRSASRTRAIRCAPTWPRCATTCRPATASSLAAVEAAPPLRAAVAASGDAELRAAYDECLRWLEAFRSTHLDYAARYIHRQSATGAANPTAVGTGGTPFMAYLRKHRDET